MAKNVIMVLADSVNRHFLSVYGNSWVKTPNIDRLAARGVTFTQHHTGSAACMPSRRELWTGCMEFPWRGWGSCEVFDEHIGRLWSRKGVTSHMVTDHYHYWELGGAYYMDQFTGCDMIRGHENDYWISDPCIDLNAMPEAKRHAGRNNKRHLRNITRLREEKDYWSPQVFSTACEWLDRNHEHGPFFLVAECFDPHEPFNVPPPYDTMYGQPIEGEIYWPNYDFADRYPPGIVERLRQFYAGKLTMVDAWFGRLLDRIDRYGLWDDTVVIFTTDHGHYIGEHNQTGKPVTYPWETLFQIPLIIHEPGGREGAQVDSLSTHVDVYATVADALGLARERPGHGRSLLPAARGETKGARECVIMGYWGQAVGCTDGRWKLHRTPVPGNRPLCAYGRDLMGRRDLTIPVTAEITAGRFMPHANCDVLRQPAESRWTKKGMDGSPSLLFEVGADPEESRDMLVARPEEAARMRKMLRNALEEIGAPAEQYERLGL